jgi:hypothetical protein
MLVFPLRLLVGEQIILKVLLHIEFTSSVYKYKVALYYLTEAVEMGYYDATYELARAHTSLAEWYRLHGGEELGRKLEHVAEGE